MNYLSLNLSKKYRTLIIGHSGLLSFLWRDFIQKDSIVFSTTHIKQFESENVFFLDFTNLAQLRKICLDNRVDLIVNCAAIANIKQCEDDYSLANDVNVAIPGFLAKISSEYGIPLIHISTDHFYSDHINIQSESDSPSLLNNYATSKWLGEKIIRESCEKHVILRTNFFGAPKTFGPINLKKSFSEQIINALLQQKNIDLFTDVFFNPVHYSTLINSAYSLVSDLCYGTFNIATSDFSSKYIFGRKIADFYSLNPSCLNPIQLSEKKLPTKRPKCMILSNSYAQSKLSFKIGSLLDNVSLLNVS